MTTEADLQALLLTKCPRVFQVVAPEGQTLPFVTWQPVGGKTLRDMTGAALDRRNTLVQVNVWASTSSAAIALIRAIEDAICASTAFAAEVQGEALSTYEEDTKYFGALQRFSIYAART